MADNLPGGELMPWLKRNAPAMMPWHDITPLLTGITSGQLLVMREGGTVWLDFQDLVAAAQGSQSYAQWNNILPPGLRPARTYTDLALAQRSSSDTAGSLRVDRYGGLTVYRHAGVIRGLVALRTEQPLPATFPGTEVTT